MVVEKKCTNFIGYYEEYRNHSNFRHLLTKMKVFNEQGTMSKEEWEAAGLPLCLLLI